MLVLMRSFVIIGGYAQNICYFSMYKLGKILQNFDAHFTGKSSEK